MHLFAGGAALVAFEAHHLHLRPSRTMYDGQPGAGSHCRAMHARHDRRQPAPDSTTLRRRGTDLSKLDPQGGNEVARDGAVVGDEGRAFDDDLRDQHPVERVTVVRRQAADGLSMLEPHIE